MFGRCLSPILRSSLTATALLAACATAPSVDSRGPVETMPAVSDLPECQAQVREAIDTLSASGLQAPTPLAQVALSSGERHSLSIPVRANTCILVSAFGSCSIRSLSLHLTEAGALSSLDSMARPYALGMACAEDRDKVFKVWIEVTEGRGEVTVAQIDVGPSNAQQLASPIVPTLSTPVNIDEATRIVDLALKGQGLTSTTNPLSKTMGEGDAAIVEVRIPKDTCLAWHAVGSPEVADIDMELFDTEGHLLAADRRTMPRPELGWCVSEPLDVRVRVICMRGKGEVRLLSYSLPANPLGQDAMAGLAETMLRSKLATVGLEQSPLQPQLRRSMSGEWSTEAFLASGQCHGIAVLSDAATLGEIAVRTTDGTTLATWKGPGSQAVLTLCPDDSTQVVVETTSNGNHAPRLLWTSTKVAR